MTDGVCGDFPGHRGSLDLYWRDRAGDVKRSGAGDGDGEGVAVVVGVGAEAVAGDGGDNRLESLRGC